MAYRIGIDVGGTFTDFTVLSEADGRIVAVHKLPTAPEEPLGTIVRGLRDLAGTLAGQPVDYVLHGTTVGLNALLTRSEPPPGLLTTAGMRDVYELGRQGRRGRLYDFFLDRPPTLTPRRLIVEVPGRLDHAGREVEPFDEAACAAAVDSLMAHGVRAIAICFLFAYANPAQERQAAELIRRRHPEIYVSTSSEVNPQFREYERTCTTMANAYVGPRVSRYLAEMQRRVLDQLPGCRVLIMQSNGGVGTPDALARTPVHTVMSGPVAGVIGARHVGRLAGFTHIMTIDVGGTSCDLSLVPGELPLRGDGTVAGHVIRAPSVDIETIGSGGGSIARVVGGRALRVGPESAGATPGPACYGNGGTEPTLTDALLLLGRLSPQGLLSGRMPLDVGLARRAVHERVARPLGLDDTAAALGIVRLLANQVAASMRTITIARGYDPRNFTLVAFGGAGPTIAGELAAELGIGRVLIPPDPGNFCALGMLFTDLVWDHSRTQIERLEKLTPEAMNRVFDDLTHQALEVLGSEAAPTDEVQIERFCEMRYAGESYEMLVPVGALADADDVARAAGLFGESHRRVYGHFAQDRPLEVVGFRLRATGRLPQPRFAPVEPGEAQPLAEARRSVRPVHFAGTGGYAEVPVFDRSRLRPGNRVTGPAIVEEQTSTTVVYPGHRVDVDAYHNLVMRLETAQ